MSVGAVSNSNLNTYCCSTYKSTKINLNYKNDNGESCKLSINTQRFQQKTVSVSNSTFSSKPAYELSPEEASKFRQSLKDELLSYKEAIIKNFMEQNGQEYRSVSDAEDSQALKELEAKIPEYWNAENTSQRIVDFATSFLSSFEGENSEFFSIIKGAIEDGFSQAKDMLGNLPGAAGELFNKTYSLTMEKLDNIERQLAGENQNQNNAEQQEFAVVA